MTRLAAVVVTGMLALVLAVSACSDGGDGGGGGGRDSAARPSSTTTITVPPWTPFTAEDARFRVVFPRQPDREEDTVDVEGGGTRKVIVYTIDVAIGEYSVVWADLEGSQVDPPALLQEVQQDVLAEVDGTLQSSEELTHKGHPARELVAKLSEGGYLKARIIVTPRDLFIVQATSPTPEPSRYAEFVGSFEVL